MEYLTKLFYDFWNRLAKQNGKVKFRSQKEAADFVRRAYNQHNGPTPELKQLMKEYRDSHKDGFELDVSTASGNKTV